MSSSINSRANDLQEAVDSGLDLANALSRYFSGQEMEDFIKWSGYGPEEEEAEEEEAEGGA